EALDATFFDRRAAPGDPDRRSTRDPAVEDHRAGDVTGLAKELAHLGAALLHLDELRLEHPDERLADVLDHVVDDVVEPDVDARRLRRALGTRLDAHVEADDDAVRGLGQQHVRLGDVAGALMDDPDLHLVVGQALQRALDRLERTLNGGLQDDVQVLDLAVLLEPLLPGHRARARLRLGTARPGPLLRDTARRPRLA